MNLIDHYLDRITMYRFLLYYLGVVLGAAMLFGAFGWLPYSPMVIALSTGFLLAACYIANLAFGRFFAVPVNPESPLITALILALIVTPPASFHELVFPAAVAGLAMASKYILTVRGQHIFNPAAVAVALTAIGAGQSASWWVGTSWLAPVVVVGGLLLVRKVRRGQMVASFVAGAFGSTMLLGMLSGAHALTLAKTTLTHSSLLFLGFVMLTEPLTSPVRLTHQRRYGVLTGLLFAPQIHVFGLYSTPELALLVGNLYAYVVNPKFRLLPRLQQKLAWGQTTRDFVFALEQPLAYQAGQYVEVTLPHARADNRGSRRYFTLASSPTEDTLRLGVRFYPEGSTFKQALLTMSPATPIAVGQLGGDFVLPDDPSQKLAFIAGGIGITPFRSMLKYLLDTGEQRDVALLYSERTAADLAYTDVLSEARARLGAHVVCTLSDDGTPIPAGLRSGMITPAMIAEEVPDYRQRVFYISGPHPMVTAMHANLKSLGVPSQQIKSDFFPGYA